MNNYAGFNKFIMIHIWTTHSYMFNVINLSGNVDHGCHRLEWVERSLQIINNVTKRDIEYCLRKMIGHSVHSRRRRGNGVEEFTSPTSDFRKANSIVIFVCVPKAKRRKESTFLEMMKWPETGVQRLYFKIKRTKVRRQFFNFRRLLRNKFFLFSVERIFYRRLAEFWKTQIRGIKCVKYSKDGEGFLDLVSRKIVPIRILAVTADAAVHRTV